MIGLYVVSAGERKWTALTWREATALINRLHINGVRNWAMWPYEPEVDR